MHQATLQSLKVPKFLLLDVQKFLGCREMLHDFPLFSQVREQNGEGTQLGLVDGSQVRRPFGDSQQVPLSQRALAERLEINFTYLSKIESEKLDFAQYPSEGLIRKLATALKADEDELLLLAKKIPADIRDHVLQRPDAFRKLAALDDDSLDEVIRHVDRRHRARC